METRDAAARWADTWQRCWEANDAQSLTTLYGAGATYRSGPFREPTLGPEGALHYLGRVLAEENEVRARFGTPIVDGRRAAVQWWASYVEEGREVTLAGTSVLRFNPHGLVVDEWDAWNETGGRLEPHPGWGAA